MDTALAARRAAWADPGAVARSGLRVPETVSGGWFGAPSVFVDETERGIAEATAAITDERIGETEASARLRDHINDLDRLPQ